MSLLIKILKILAIIAIFSAESAFSDDFFDDNFSRDYKAIAYLTENSTIGGYPIYKGGRTWKVLSGKSSLNNENWRLGSVSFLSPINQKYFAEMHLTANLNENNGHYSADICNGVHLVKFNKGGGLYDNCLIIDPYLATVRGKNITTLQIRVRNSQLSARLYDLNLLLNVEYLGFPDTGVYDWTDDSISRDSRKKKLIEKLIDWATRLQDGVSKAIDYKKPKDAFDNVPLLSELLNTTADNSIILESKVEEPVLTLPAFIPKTIEQRLSELKSLLDKKLINQNQYEVRSTEIIKSF